MSSAETASAGRASRRYVVQALLLLGAAAPVLAACSGGGFHPLYGVTPSGARTQERMAQVEVAPIPGRVGQRIRNEVMFQNTGGGEPLPPTHRLEVTIKENVLSTLVKPDGSAAGSVYAVEATFRVVKISDKKIVLQGTSIARAAYENSTIASIPTGSTFNYANVRAREDAENRAARVIADDLKTRVAAYLSGAA
jgi:LPS-assembly lipoprotein